MPALSIVVAGQAPDAPVGAFWDALAPQVGRPDVELIVADRTGRAVAGAPETARCLTPAPDASLPTLLGAALATASGDAVALTDTTTLVASDWVATALALAARHPLVGGAVDPGPAQDAADWTAYLCDYVQFMRPFPAGPADELPGNNVVFRRELLQRGQEFVRPAFWKTYWCRALAEEGVPLRRDPSLVAYNAKTYRLRPFLQRRYRHGRCFGGMRMPEAPAARRALYAAASPALPAVFLRRIAAHVRSRPAARGALLRHLPSVAAAVTCWCAGEGLGYLAGPGDACASV